MVFVPSPVPSQDAGFGMSPAECGYLAWTQDPTTCAVLGATSGINAGRLFLRRMSVAGFQSVTNLHMIVVAAGATLTAAQCFAALWDGNGRLVGVSADQSGAWSGASQVLVSMPLALSGAAGPFLITTPYVYAGWWFNGTTGPQMLTGLANSGFLGPALTNPIVAPASLSTGPLTTLATAPANLRALAPAPVVASLAHWFALS